MRIEHIALWARDVDGLSAFYVRHFGAMASPRYVNEKKRFASIFLSFDSGARLELMQRPDILPAGDDPHVMQMGYTHMAISVGSEQEVDALTRKLEAEGCVRLDGPRRTGDGYYESVILDPEGNRIEITV
ncbi:VOC family protein [Uliginosibacterium sp. sgz301328]|uniref:VOC family protein n=1 Tax=Uliginosibacterium sp. sgz301328 TaxID=3243764 RepID=UPI00359DFD0B